MGGVVIDTHLSNKLSTSLIRLLINENNVPLDLHTLMVKPWQLRNEDNKTMVGISTEKEYSISQLYIIQGYGVKAIFILSNMSQCSLLNVMPRFLDGPIILWQL